MSEGVVGLEGVFRARGVSGGLGLTAGQKEQVVVDFVLLNDDNTEGTHIAWYGYFTEKTMDRTIESLRICGWTGDDLTNLAGIDANEVELVIGQEPYDGKMYTKVRWVNRPGGGVSIKAPLPPDAAKSFAARMRGQILAHDKKAGLPKVRTPVASPNPPPHSDADAPIGPNDDIPF